MRESYQKKKKTLPDHSGHPEDFWGRKGSHWSDLDKTWGKSSDL